MVLLKVNLRNSLLFWKLCLVFKVHFPPLNFKVEGDTVTFSFEMRSGREHNTPDKAMWGFACTVRAQVLESNHRSEHNVLSPLYLGYTHHICLGNGAEYEPLFHPSLPFGRSRLLIVSSGFLEFKTSCNCSSVQWHRESVAGAFVFMAWRDDLPPASFYGV